eukprot:120693_1
MSLFIRSTSRFMRCNVFLSSIRRSSGDAQKQRLVPPFTEETARAKMQAAEDAWNTSDPQTIANEYTTDGVWRKFSKDTVFVSGHDEMKPFLVTKFEKQKKYRIKKEYFAHTDNGIALSCQYQYSHNETGEWYGSYGCEHWTFDKEGKIAIMDVMLATEELISK